MFSSVDCLTCNTVLGPLTQVITQVAQYESYDYDLSNSTQSALDSFKGSVAWIHKAQML